jgi:hypothetical protein
MIIAEEILNYRNNSNRHLRFKIAYKENGKINVLDLLITRNEDNNNRHISKTYDY